MTASALAAELGPGVRVIKHDRGLFYGFPLSLISTPNDLLDAEAYCGVELNPLRFGPNLLVELIDDTPFPEEEGAIGSAPANCYRRMRVDNRDQRCIMVNVDPDSDQAERSGSARDRSRAAAAVLGVTGPR